MTNDTGLYEPVFIYGFFYHDIMCFVRIHQGI
jgi:hypothetical protein